MLRAFVIALGIAFLAGAVFIAIAWSHAWPAAIECGIFGALIVAGTLFERHYRSRPTTSTAGWSKTRERFIDPTTGKLVDVHYNSETGQRSYVPVD